MNKKETKQGETESFSDVRNYFTKEVNKKISEMTLKEMEVLMKEMIYSKEWIAILKYINTRTVLLDSQLRTIDPSKDPHTISWSQGALAGISDIENYVISLNASKGEKEDTKN